MRAMIANGHEVSVLTVSHFFSPLTIASFSRNSDAATIQLQTAIKYGLITGDVPKCEAVECGILDNVINMHDRV
jgi:hypothetical protein